MTSGGSSITFSNASAPSAAITTSQKGSRDFETRSRISGLSSARSSLTVLPAAAVICCLPAFFGRTGAGNRDQRFHLHASLRRGGCPGLEFHSIFAQAGGHINVGEGDGMTKRYPLSGALGGGDAGDARDFEGIAFGVFQATDGAEDFRRHADEGVGNGGAGGDGLRGDVDHADFAAGGVGREFWQFGLCEL